MCGDPEAAQGVEEAEGLMVKAVPSGMSLKAARGEMGYHSLPTKDR